VCLWLFLLGIGKKWKKEEKPATPKNGGGSGSDEPPPGLAVSQREESKTGLSDENGQGEVGF
jgi:hypothetical protein